MQKAGGEQQAQWRARSTEKEHHLTASRMRRAQPHTDAHHRVEVQVQEVPLDHLAQLQDQRVGIRELRGACAHVWITFVCVCVSVCA